MWVYAGLDERGLGKEVKAVLPDKRGRKEGGGGSEMQGMLLDWLNLERTDWEGDTRGNI